AAAVTLAEAGADVHVLEARERAGGRVLTLRAPFDDDLFAEGGAEFISAGHEVMRQFLRRFGLATRPRLPGPRTLFFDGQLWQGQALDDLGGQIARDAERVERLSLELGARVPDPAEPWRAPDADQLDSRSVASWLDDLALAPLVRSYHQVWKTVDYGVEPGQLSLLMHARDERL